MRPIVVKAARIVGGLALLFFIIGFGAYLYLLRSLPTVAGTFEVDGLSGPVEIVRDAEAVPHIVAKTKLDALFGLGFVHAQDRLWQMEFQRRVGHGRLSEVLGTATIPQDRFLRTVGFGRAAQAAWDRLPADARAQVDAYVAGVNAFIDSHHGSRLPPEFSLLRLTPEPWTGPDVLVWVKMMAWDLSANYSTELLRHDIAARVGGDRMKELLPAYPADGLTILPSTMPLHTRETGSRRSVDSAVVESAVADAPDLRRRAAADARSWTEAFATALSSAETVAPDFGLTTGQPALAGFLLGGGGAVEGLGSNNWVVDGTLTTSGKPLLANDPHLGGQIPSLWYLAHLTAGDFDVIGATLPGTPAVAIGRNRYIAWGETNMFADVQDLYREHLDEAGNKAEFRGAWEPLRRVQEAIRVKGAADVVVDVRISRHGPLVSDAINANNAAAASNTAELEPLAFRWTALDDDDSTIVAFFALSEARNWADFTDAMREFVVPSQNFVYADVDGHIGYYAPGRIPIRANGDGLTPADGWTGEKEWTGWIPFDELPHTYDPPSHFIVTANNRPVPADYKYLLGFEYHEPYRAERITELLHERPAFSPDDFAAIQADTFSLHAKTLLPILLDHVHPDSSQSRQAVDILRRWNLNATADSAGAAIFEAWFLRLAPELVAKELGPTVTRAYERRFTFVTRFVSNSLRTGGTFCAKDVAFQGGDGDNTSSCDRAVTRALDGGLEMLATRLGGRMSGWRWEDAHAAVFRHQALDSIPVLGWFLRRSVPNRGDWSTVNVGAVDVERPFEQREVSGYRQIVDLSTRNDSRFLGSVGQSGHFLSSSYDNVLHDWHDVRHTPMRMNPDALKSGATARLHLRPRHRDSR